MTLHLSSSAFSDGQPIPVEYTCDGKNISPPLHWEGVPEGTRSLALVCCDPDAPAGTWHHWAVYNLPPTLTNLPANFSVQADIKGVVQGVNDFGDVGYGGPCPPSGHGLHHYRFHLLALNISDLQLLDDCDCCDIGDAANEHVIEKAALVGTYTRA